jgi:hypothetical protein
VATATFVGLANWGFTNETANTTTTAADGRVVTGTGWIPINLTAISSGAPISSWPVDPLNSGVNFYIYAATSTAPATWKVATKMESVKYGYNGPNDVTTGDGGNSTGTYEQGSNLTGL